MKITIEKFGPIDKFEYDLDKELIITYGNNNIGKSYAMQIVYLMLKTFIVNMFITPRTYHQIYLYPRRIDISLPEEISVLFCLFLKSRNYNQSKPQLCYMPNFPMVSVFEPELFS